ncbi:hypothetical protein R1flu_024013 [Riccia fluitans]|uniref:Uncharacterized protein n=1 Tax=Riccia fluitans TaxID=41844 RepID=A0ABD1XTP2_9MARC
MSIDSGMLARSVEHSSQLKLPPDPVGASEGIREGCDLGEQQKETTFHGAVARRGVDSWEDAALGTETPFSSWLPRHCHDPIRHSAISVGHS